ncbi:Multicopper oxidase [Fusarium sp. LHS14.1]|nr:Multicopper oxidase [Fusarium sp. LHS14.1]
MADTQPREPPDPRESKPRSNGNKRWSPLALCLFVAACSLTVLITVDFILFQFSQQHQSQSQPASDHIEPVHDQASSVLTWDPKSASATRASVQATSETSSAFPNNIAPPRQFRISNDLTIQTKPTIRDYVFNITRGLAAPGRYNKSMILVNGQTPGPLIEANVGDTIRVKVNNLMLNESTTIHWHGIDQRDTVWMDGVFGITQCGIPPGETFTYQFDIIDQRGTFWYHSHLSLQNTDGLYGPMIIHDRHEKIGDIDEDRIVMVGDLYHQPAEELLSQYLSPSPPWSLDMPGMEPPADNVLINGHHRSECRLPTDGARDSGIRTGKSGAHSGDDNNPDACVDVSPFSIRVNSGATVRLRVINHGTFLPFWFSVDNHTLEVVEMDGVEIQPLPTTRLFLHPGQRYSAILTANQTEGNYLIRAAAARWCFDPMDDSLYPPTSNLAKVGFQATEVLSYSNTPDNSQPIGVPGNHTDSGIMSPWVEECLDLPFDLPQPLRSKSAYQVGEKNHHFFEYKMVLQDGAYYTVVNETNYAPLSSDAALWRVLAANDSSAETGSGRDSWDFVGSHLERWRCCSRLINTLSGQAFQVVGWGEGLYGKGKTTWKLDNPMRRDTVTIPGSSHLIIRIPADNPGIWAFHCHLLWHAHGGMFVAIGQQMEKLQNMLQGQDVSSDFVHRFCSGSMN